MKKADLIALGLAEDVAEKVIVLHGKDIEGHKARLTSMQAEHDATKAQLTDANKQIEEFKGMNVDQIKAAADEYKTKFEQAQQEHATQMQQVKFDHALDGALTNAKARNPKALRALLSMDALKLQDDGSILGLNEQLEKIKSENDYLFEGAKQDPKIVTGTKMQSAVPLSMEQIKKMTPAEINQNWEAVQTTLASQPKK